MSLTRAPTVHCNRCGHDQAVPDEGDIGVGWRTECDVCEAVLRCAKIQLVRWWSWEVVDGEGTPAEPEALTSLDEHLERVKLSGLVVIEDEGNIILVGCKDGVTHKISVCPFRNDSVGAAVIELIGNVRRKTS